MDQRIVLIVEEGIEGGLDAARRCGRQLSYEIQQPVLVIDVTRAQLDTIGALVEPDGAATGQELRSGPRTLPSSAPMAAAPFAWRDDGLPDWGNMWQDFCELALFGGPPHRGPESALHAAGGGPSAEDAPTDAPAEIRRGIAETTGLESEIASDGWLAVRCDSTRMAAWLCATILLENVDARCDGSTLFVPAAPDFELQDQVKSVITVLAKTHHYWQAHVVSTSS